MSSPPRDPPIPPDHSAPSDDSAGIPPSVPERPPFPSSMSFFFPLPDDAGAGPSENSQGGADDAGPRRPRGFMRFDIFPAPPHGSAPPAPPVPDNDAPIAQPPPVSLPANQPTPNRGHAPTVFLITPDGQLVPHPTHPANADPTNNPSNQQPNPAGDRRPEDDGAPRFPSSFPGFIPFQQMFGPLQFGFPPPEPQPDPEKAAELLRSLPSVSKGLFERVDRVYKAENGEGEGWKCGVCLEGLDVGEDEEGTQGETVLEGEQPLSGAGVDERMGAEAGSKGTGVKVLPCNHLFHGTCLGPWFQTKHTCPSCRLNLDPLQTLRPAETRESSVRPNATGGGRSPQATPYGRRSATPASSNDASQLIVAPFARPLVTQAAPPDFSMLPDPLPIPNPGDIDIAAPAELHPPNPFGFPWPVPPSVTAMLQPDVRATPAAQTMDRSRLFTPILPVPTPVHSPTVAQADIPDRPSTPDRTIVVNFDIPLRTSPLPMERSASAPSPSLGPAIPPSAPALNIDGRPQPERRPHITFVHHNHPHPNGLPHHQHIPHQPVPTIQPLHLHHHHHHHHHHHQPPQQHLGPLPTPPAARSPPAHVFPFAFPFPPHLRPHPPTSITPPSKSTFVPQSLESWTSDREKSLGWRCDSPLCLIAPAITEEAGVQSIEDREVWTEEAREKVSIMAAVQPSHQHPEHEKQRAFMRLACEHRWHRGCVEAEERASGRWGPSEEEDGKMWVRCGVCRKDGWVQVGQTYEATPSEIEVERSVVA